MRDAIARARASLPWPVKEVLADGSIRCSGLTEDEINQHLIRQLLAEMATLTLDERIAHKAARAVFEAESRAIGVALDESQFAAGLNLYQLVAMVSFKVILKELGKTV